MRVCVYVHVYVHALCVSVCMSTYTSMCCAFVFVSASLFGSAFRRAAVRQSACGVGGGKSVAVIVVRVCM